MWRVVTLQEFPEMVDLIPDPTEITLDRLDSGSVMTDTCNSAQLCNRLLCAVVKGVIYSSFCHNHLRNVWVKNVLLSLK